MARYVKDCPRDGHVNPEIAHVCEVCGEFLGGVAPREERLGESQEPASESSPSGLDQPSAVAGEPLPERAPPQPGPSRPEGHRTREEVPGALFYLESTFSGEVYPVPPRSMLGRDDPESLAQVRIRTVSGCPSIQEIHRRHCVFEFDNRKWWLVPLNQQEFGGRFTNTTSVNDRPVPPGQRHALNDGDVLRFSLSGTPFKVKIL